MSIDTGEGAGPDTTDRPALEAETAVAADATRSPSAAEISDADEKPLADDDSPPSELDALDAAEEPLGTEGSGVDDAELTDADLSDDAEESLGADGAEKPRDDDRSKVAPPQERPGAADETNSNVAEPPTTTAEDIQSTDTGSPVREEVTATQDPVPAENASVSDHDGNVDDRAATQEVVSDATAPTRGENIDETASALTEPDSVQELTPTDYVSHEYEAESPVPSSEDADSSSPSQNKLDATVSFVEEMLTTEHGSGIISFIDREVFRNADAISKNQLTHPEGPALVELDRNPHKPPVESSQNDRPDTREDAQYVGETGEVGADQRLQDALPESPDDVRSFLQDVMDTEYKADLISFLDLAVGSDSTDVTLGARMTVESEHEPAPHEQPKNSEVKPSTAEGFGPMPLPSEDDDNGEPDRQKLLQPGEIVEVVKDVEVEESAKGVAWTAAKTWEGNPTPGKTGIELASGDNLEKVRDMARERGLSLDRVSDLVKEVADIAGEYVGGLSLTAATAVDIVLHRDDYRDWAAAWATDATYRGGHRASDYRGKHRG